jgi:hypothetical protein
MTINQTRYRRPRLLFAAALSVMALAALQLPRAIADDILPGQIGASEQAGQVDLRDIDLNQPILTSFLQRPLPSPREGSGAAQTITLNRLRFEFRRSSDKLVIRNGSVCHDAFAATIDGYAGLPAGDLHFSGVLWPLFEGSALLADPTPAAQVNVKNRERDIFPVGMRYEVTGSHTAPMLRLNPFADEYPGALRRVAEACHFPPPLPRGG